MVNRQIAGLTFTPDRATRTWRHTRHDGKILVLSYTDNHANTMRCALVRTVGRHERQVLAAEAHTSEAAIKALITREGVRS